MGVRCVWVGFVVLALGVARAHAQAPSAETPVVADTSSASAEPAAEPASDADAAANAEPDASRASSANAHRSALSDLQLKLADVKRQRADTSTLWPWVVTLTGLAIVVAGVAVGSAGTLACAHSCRAGAWAPWFVVGGSLVGSAGAVWVSLTARDLFELDARRHNLEFQLQNERWDQAQSSRSPHMALTLKGSF